MTQEIRRCKHPIPPFLQALCARIPPVLARLNLHSRCPVNQITANCYTKASGHSIGRHADHRQVSGVYIINLSLVTDTTMVFRNPANGPELRVYRQTLQRRALQVCVSWGRSVPGSFHLVFYFI